MCNKDCGSRKEDILDCANSKVTSKNKSKVTVQVVPTPTPIIVSSSESSPSSLTNTPPSPSSSTTSSSCSSSSGKEIQQQRTVLSRRQRKNRMRAPREQQRELRERDEDHEDDHNGPPPSPDGKSNVSSANNNTAANPLAPHRRHRSGHRRSEKQQQQNEGTLKTSTITVFKASSNSKQSKNNGKKKNSAGANPSGVVVGNKSKMLTTSSKYAIVTRYNCFSRTVVYEQHSSSSDLLGQLSEAALASLLRRYALSGDQLAQLGYPVELSQFPGFAVIIGYQQQHPRILHYRHATERSHHLDANAQEFVPSAAVSCWSSNSSGIDAGDADSGTGSAGSSSLESSDLEQDGSYDSDKCSDVGESMPRKHLIGPGGNVGIKTIGGQHHHYHHHTSASLEKQLLLASRLQTAIGRRCARCAKTFYVNRDDGEYLQEDKCTYHWGKLRGADNPPYTGTWECCRGRESSRGCTAARAHVWTGIMPGYNGPFPDFARTRPSRQVPHDGNYGVYALDCEMCFTKCGLELGKVSVVALDGTVVYETLVKPEAEVIDYNTRFSGLRARDLVKATKTLRDVQKDITSFVFAETILIGHGLENDLRALRLLHTTVVDTCVAFPHFLGYPYRNSLKTLARTVLKKEVQTKEHDSTEDARVVIDLMLTRLQHDFL